MPGVSIRGSWPELGRLAGGLELLATDFRKMILNQVAQEALQQIYAEFEESRDPYGNPWAPPRSRPGGKPLLDTGRLRNSFSARATGSGFVVQTNVGYAATHQYGARIAAKEQGKPLRFRVGGRGGKGQWRSKYSVRIPQRAFLPNRGRLGPIWSQAFKDVVDEVIQNLIEKGR